MMNKFQSELFQELADLSINVKFNHGELPWVTYRIATEKEKKKKPYSKTIQIPPPPTTQTKWRLYTKTLCHHALYPHQNFVGNHLTGYY